MNLSPPDSRPTAPSSPTAATGADSAPFVHPTAIVDSGAQVGASTRIWHWVHVCDSAVIGERCTLGQNVFIGPKTRIGNNVRIQNNVSVYDGVELEDDVFCGPSMVFTNVINPRSHVSRKSEFRPTRVRRGATIGANATIICGVTLGAYCMIGAGAVVSRDVRPYSLVAGVPARHLGWICSCGSRLPEPRHAKAKASEEVACPECARRYRAGVDACQPLDEASAGTG